MRSLLENNCFHPFVKPSNLSFKNRGYYIFFHRRANEFLTSNPNYGGKPDDLIRLLAKYLLELISAALLKNGPQETTFLLQQIYEC